FSRRYYFQLEKRRKDEVKRSIEEDEAEIKRYATLLGYKKRKSTKIPQVFRAEGLDYLLELCDPVKDREDLAEESEQSQSDVEEFDEEHMAAEEIDLNEDTCNSDADVRVKQKENESEVSANKSALKCDGKKGLKRRNVQGSKEDCSDESCGIKEDIYGRLVDRKTGEIVSKGANAGQRLLDLKKGSYVKEVLFDALYKSAAVGYRLPDRILIEYALFIALLHSTVSVEIC
uniref:Uncharacterized protein n=1 Tax=Parascaris equorum TaxID=6256 RepID=A0A914RQG0_PAREQ